MTMHTFARTRPAPRRRRMSAAFFALLGAAFASGCGAESTDDNGPIATVGGIEQPTIRPVEGTATLGTGPGEQTEPGDVPTQVVQAVAGANFVCALDDVGSVWCWGDRAPHWVERPASLSWPATPTRVKGAPALGTLLVPVALSDGSTPTTFGGACGLDEFSRWWCWGAHPGNPLSDRPDLVTAVLVDDPGRPATPDVPGELLGEIDALGGFAFLGTQTCAMRTAGGVVCWPGVADPVADRIDGFPRGTRLAGQCAATPDGRVSCAVPFDTAPGCALALTSLNGMGARVCGERADGEWRCVGRPVGSGAVELPGLRDVTMPDCE